MSTAATDPAAGVAMADDVSPSSVPADAASAPPAPVAKETPEERRARLQARKLRRQSSIQNQKAQATTTTRSTGTGSNIKPRRRSRAPPTYHASKSRKYAGWYHKMAEQNRLGAITESLGVSDHDSVVAPDLSEADELPQNRQFCVMYSPTSRCVDCQRKANECTCDKDAPAIHPTLHRSNTKVQEAKTEILQELNRTMGEMSPAVHQSLQTLLENHDGGQFNPRAYVSKERANSNRLNVRSTNLEGIGLSAGKPTFPGCIGKNDRGDPMYKLGTMAFGKLW